MNWFKKTPEYKVWKVKAKRENADKIKRTGPNTIGCNKRVKKIQEMYLHLNEELPLEDESKKE